MYSLSCILVLVMMFLIDLFIVFTYRYNDF